MESFEYKYKAYITNIVDGDTIDLQLNLGFHVSITERVRLAGIDTPETYGVKKDSEEYAAGMAAKKFVEAKLTPLSSKDYVVVETIKDKTGMYGRYLARIWYLEDAARKEWVCINDKLVELGLAEVY